MTEQLLPGGREAAVDPSLPSPGGAAPPPRAAWPRIATAMALALALLAAMSAGLLFWQYREFYVALHSADTELEAAIEASGRELTAAASRLTDLPERVGGVERQLGELPARLGSLERRLDAAQGGSHEARTAWLAAEAEYYLTIASAELELAGRWDGAVAALELADARLNALGDPRLARVRQQIAAERQSLEAVDRADVDRVVFDLASLAERVGDLPLRGSRGAGRSADPLAGAEPGLGRLWRVVQISLAGIVRVERRGPDAAEGVSALGRALASRELAVELRLARLAAMQRQGRAFEASIAAAAGLLERDFDTEAPGVRAAAALLEELARARVAPAPPDISGSLALLRNILSESD